MKIKIKQTRHSSEDFPKNLSLYEKAVILIKTLKGQWEVKNGHKITVKVKESKPKKKDFDLR